jgi:hypothetical protein
MKKPLPLLVAAALLAPCILYAQSNLVLNPGFEDGLQSDAPPWGVGGWRGSIRATTDDKHSGRRSLRLEGGGDEGGINSAVQIIPIDPTGKTKYHFRAWMSIPAATAEAPRNGRTRWMFSEGTGGGQVTPLNDSQWTQIDEGTNELKPPAGAQHIIFRVYGLTGRDAVYIDDCELVGEATGEPSYPGISGTVKDAAGKPVAGAVVFLNSNAKAQEFANSSAVTDSSGNFTVCVKENGDYYAVAWKAGYSLSTETKVSLASGNLKAFNPTITQGTGGRNLAISTAARATTVGVTQVGTLNDPQFKPEYVFDGNSISTRYYNNVGAEPAKDRWIYVDLDPAGKKSFAVREFVLTWLGVTQNTQGWPGLGDVAAKSFALEYTTGDPATEANWASKVAFSVTEAPATFEPVVIRLDAPITARAIRFHVTDGGFGPTEVAVNADTLSRGTLAGVVKDTTGAPIAGVRVVTWRPTHIQSDPDIYGAGNAVPFVVYDETVNGTPYDIPVSKSIEQTYVTDAQGRYTFDVHPGRPIRVSALAEGFAYDTAAVTPPADGAAATQDLVIGKSVVLSGVIRNASGPLANALVQVGPAGSKYVVITRADGTYSFSVGAGTHELFADAPGYAANTQSVTLTANAAKDVTLIAATEAEAVNATFDANISGWEVATYDTNWVNIGTAAAAVRDTTENATPGGSGSAVIEDKNIFAADGTTELPVGYRLLQRTSAQRIAVQSGKAYSVYFKVKAENWVTPEHNDAVLYQVVWRNAAGKVVGSILSHPHWLYPQPFWYICDRGHMEGADDSITLARLSPPTGAATLDVRIGWVRNRSATNPDTLVSANPEGSLLYVDDLVVDAVAVATKAEPTISIARDGANLKITYVGTLEFAANVTGDWTPVAGATSPHPVTPSLPNIYYRTRR